MIDTQETIYDEINDRMITRVWYPLTEEVIDSVEVIYGESLLEAKIKSLDLNSKENYPKVRVVASLKADNIRRVSILAPGILSANGFDLYQNKESQFSVIVQYGDIISMYQDTW